jgi:hypothetical protein
MKFKHPRSEVRSSAISFLTRQDAMRALQVIHGAYTGKTGALRAGSAGTAVKYSVASRVKIAITLCRTIR